MIRNCSGFFTIVRKIFDFNNHFKFEYECLSKLALYSRILEYNSLLIVEYVMINGQNLF